MASRLSGASRDHLASTTQEGYSSALKRYTGFCSDRQISPFPVDPVWLAAWILHVTSSISVPSLKVYLASVKDAQGTLGFPWKISGNELVRRSLRFVKRKYGIPGKASKIPISLAILRRIFVFLPGWPTFATMSHDDRLFATASMIAVSAFLRGGEFLASSDSGRRILRSTDVTISKIAGAPAVVVGIPQPKARWWLDRVFVPCFPVDAAGDFDVVRMLRSYRALSSVPLSAHGPAFVMSSGDALSKVFMLRRTSELLSMANIVIVDDIGQEVRMKASSWRAGGVRSAIDAGIPQPTIMALGRWKSLAWASYLLLNSSDLRGAALAMWKAAEPISPVLRVGVLLPADELQADVVELEEEVARLTVARSTLPSDPDSARVFRGGRRAVG